MKECCRKYLEDQFGDNPDIVAEIYNEYVSSMAAKLKEAKSNLDGKQWEPLDRTAHTIKGNALSAGDEDMANVAIELRGAARLQDEAAAKGLVVKLESLYGNL